MNDGWRVLTAAVVCAIAVAGYFIFRLWAVVVLL